MRPAPLLLPLVAVVLGACTSTARRPEFSAGYPVHDCPDALEGQVQLRAEVRPVQLSEADFRQSSVPTVGSLARRLLVSITPAGLSSDDRIVWSTLSADSFGGTFLGWDRLQTQSGAPDEQSEIGTVALAPGQLKITRVAQRKTNLAGMHSIDVLLMPGGVAVDDTVLRIPNLWRDDGTPTPASALTPQFLPVRHPPALDIVEATLQLDFVVRIGKTREEWSCSADTRLTLVDQESLRQPFWDIGLAPPNSARRDWLAVFAPDVGGVRLTFESPASAHAFADWLRATRATQLGTYELRVFRQPSRRGGRPFGPLAQEAMQTLRPLAAEDLRALTVGPVGEP
jgi:hypothetical protein